MMIQDKIESIITDIFDVDRDDITLHTEIFDDLGADCSDISDLQDSLETSFNIKIAEDDMYKMTTIEDIITHISSKCRIS